MFSFSFCKWKCRKNSICIPTKLSRHLVNHVYQLVFHTTRKRGYKNILLFVPLLPKVGESLFLFLSCLVPFKVHKQVKKWSITCNEKRVDQLALTSATRIWSWVNYMRGDVTPRACTLCSCCLCTFTGRFKLFITRKIQCPIDIITRRKFLNEINFCSISMFSYNLLTIELKKIKKKYLIVSGGWNTKERKGN